MCTYTGLPAAGTVDVVTFSYALTMIPDWKEAIRNAFRMLKKVLNTHLENLHVHCMVASSTIHHLTYLCIAVKYELD